MPGPLNFVTWSWVRWPRVCVTLRNTSNFVSVSSALCSGWWSLAVLNSTILCMQRNGNTYIKAVRFQSNPPFPYGPETTPLSLLFSIALLCCSPLRLLNVTLLFDVALLWLSLLTFTHLSGSIFPSKFPTFLALMFNNSSNVIVQGGTFIIVSNADRDSLGRCPSTWISTLANLKIS